MTAERMLELHEAAIQAFGGDPGLHKGVECVEAIIRGARNAASYRDGETTFVMAAYLLIKAVYRHCFVDGNKRVAWLSAVDYLRTAADLDLRAT